MINIACFSVQHINGSKTLNCDVTYDFNRGEQYSYSVISASDVELYAKSKAGLYAWYIRVLPHDDPLNNMKIIDNIFASKRMNLVASGNLGEEFSGSIGKSSFFSGDASNYHELVHAASAVFSPPIYVGMSKDIKTRLTQHWKSLCTSVYENNFFDDVDNVVTDSDDESRQFGQRIGRLLKNQKIRNTKLLFVKVIYSENVAREALLSTESYINRLIIPMCGRK